ncbi:putative Calumenin-A [Cocos nucifera]|uniref:Putative Calumenin-A n=1 Tax=Cocos nucifera TaxID=13894 RepID=A0A8K0HWP2_COCNU|nr:putative Calumenin-A [Cocos nucifera]
MEDYSDYQKHHRSESREQADARHRQEMLNMVNNMSDSTFEVSLRYLMELPKIGNSIQETPGKGKEDKFLSVEEQKKAKKGMKRGSRSESMDNGAFLLKVFSPVFLGGRRKSSVTSDSSLPKPMLTDGEKGMLEKNTAGKWWKENELGYLSENSGTNSRRR